ncbi:hypothetical protein F5887DRAFT_935519 [Amanita rubescens]|nr:hypothetical protein F5887DRAFT_935519 [Amanita rubescens]
MVFSVDDLVSSLSNNHIGQEAIDLAALHAQLAQALFAQQSAPSRPSVQVKTCTTPTSTMSYPWNPVSPVGMDDSMECQDERMVEELLIPNVQAQTYPLSLHCAPEESQYPSSAGPSRHSRYQVHSTSTSDHSPAFDPPSCSSPTSSPSFFTSKDPFYIAQLQETQGQSHSANALARLGKPDEASPFLLVPQTQTQTPHQQQAQYHQRPVNSGVGGDTTYSAVGPYGDLLYQREQMYHHQYCAATAVGS